MSKNLEQLQRWMLDVITHPGGIAAETAAGEIDRVVLPSRSMTSSERMVVYGNAYYARLLECLREFFPCLVHAVGEETFDEFAVAYLQKHPPQSYSLNHLADRFPQFLEDTRPVLADEELSWPDFAIDLARLEQAIDGVFDGPGPEGEPILLAADLQKVDAQIWPEMRLEFVPGLQLLAFRFPVSTYYTAWKRDESPAFPRAEPQFAAIFRRDFIVRRLELSRPQFDLLQALSDGATVGGAIAIAAAQVLNVQAFACDLQQWFATWASSQLIARVLAHDHDHAN